MGDQTLFASTREVQAMWKFTDPITNGWANNLVPLETYLPDSNDLGDIAAKIGTYSEANEIKQKSIGVFGLGKMGAGIAVHFAEKGWNVIGYNRTESVTKALELEGIKGRYIRCLRKP
jgi:hypothetical protein